MSHADSHDSGGRDDATRREFLYVATGAVGAVGVATAVWPLVDQMNPSADVLAMASIEVDVSGVEPGIQITKKWRGKPIFIRNRTKKEIEEARAVKLDQLKDRLARNPNLPGNAPATDENRTIGGREDWMVMIGICTHLGCVPLGNEAGKYNGWFCPCHGSQYDTAGRIREGPAPENMFLPPAKWLSKTVVKLG